MTLLKVDGAAVPVENSRQTVGEVIDDVIRLADAEGRRVTAVRLDGVAVPDAADSTVRSRPLGTVSIVDIDCDAGIELVAECLEEAAVGLTALSRAARHSAQQFRSGGVAAASGSLAALTQGVATALAVIDAAAALLQKMEVPLPDGRTHLATTTGDRISTLIAAHEAGDWIELADLLEYDLAETLDEWVRISRTLQGVARQPKGSVH